MQIDARATFAGSLAFDGTATILDLGSAVRGKGGPIKCFISGHSLVAATGFIIKDGTVAGTAATTRQTNVVDLADLNDGPVEFYLPTNVQRYVTITLVGATTSGTWDAGIVLGVNTAR